MARITICDSTLRDGSHAKRHQISVEEVRAVSAALDEAGVPVVEISHGDGLGGASFNYGFSQVDELELISAAAEVMQHGRVAVLLLPGIGVKDDVLKARDCSAGVARIATHCTEADVAPQHIALSRETGLTTVGFLMMAHMATPDGLAEQARIMADAGAEIVYVTDSAGALLPDTARERVAALRAALPRDVVVGFHAHHNLALGVANSLAAIETGIDPFAIMDVAEEVVRPRLTRVPVVDRAALLLGYAGVYSSFLLHAERAAERFGVSSKELLVEIGRRQAVGGQEDMIIDIAAELAAAAT